MHRRAIGLAALLACTLAAACGGLEPASFEVVDIERARAILRDGDVEVVLTDSGAGHGAVAGSDADTGGPSGAKAVPPGALSPASGGGGDAPAAGAGAPDDALPGRPGPESTVNGDGQRRAGRVLVVAAAPELGYRSAAALARSGRSPVVLVIASRDADLRSLVALTQQRTEATADEQDS